MSVSPSSFVSLTVYLTFATLTTLLKKPFENIVEIGENAGNPAFSPIPTMFSTLSKTEIIILALFNLLSANVFNLVKSEKFLYGKELGKWLEIASLHSDTDLD